MDDWGQRDARWSGVRSERIDVAGHAATILRRDAEPSARDAVPQLLVHGLGGSARNWLEVMGPLAAWGPVVAVDLPGFGETELPPGGSARLPANAGFVAAAARALGWDRVVLYGNSMGGTISTLVAGRWPELVDRLVLVNPALPIPRAKRFTGVRDRAKRRVAFAGLPVLGQLAIQANFRYRDAERIVDDTVRGVYADPAAVRPVVRELYVESVNLAKEWPWRRRALAQAAQSLIQLLVVSGSLYRAIDAVEADTLVLWGDHDALIAGPVIDALRARKPHWDLHVFPEVGHAPMLEAPDDFVKAVGAWLDTGSALAGGAPLEEATAVIDDADGEAVPA